MFVQDVGTDSGNDDIQDTGLRMRISISPASSKRRGKPYTILRLNIRALLLNPFQLSKEFFKEMLRILVIFAIRQR